MKDLKNKTRDAVVQIAEWQVGVMETPANSNRVKYNTWFYGKEIVGSHYPWCMAFIVWCFHQAGFNLKKTAGCTELRLAYEGAGQWVTSGYKVGDIAMFDFSGKRKKTEHCGLVVEIHPNYIVTIEGNTSPTNNANGGAVMRRERKYNVVTGACRPLYNL